MYSRDACSASLPPHACAAVMQFLQLTVLLLASPCLLILMACTAEDRQGSPSRPLDVEDTDLRPGLVAEYKSLANENKHEPLVRVDAKPAFTWGTSSPHPRIAPGPFEVTWTGLLNVGLEDRIRFRAFLGGEVSISIGKQLVLQGRCTKPQDAVTGEAEFD